MMENEIPHNIKKNQESVVYLSEPKSKHYLSLLSKIMCHVPPSPFISITCIMYSSLSLSFLVGRVGRLNSRHARHPHPLIPPARYSCLRETFRLCFRQFKAKIPSLNVGNSIYIVLIHRARSANWLNTSPIIRNKCKLFLTSSLDRSIFELSCYVGLSFWASFRSGSTFTRAVTRCWQRQRFTSKLFFSVETFPPESWMICSRPPFWQNLSGKIWKNMFTLKYSTNVGSLSYEEMLQAR